jgi:hypothetical protein
MYGEWDLLVRWEKLTETQYKVKNMNSKQNKELVTIDNLKLNSVAFSLQADYTD